MYKGIGQNFSFHVEMNPFQRDKTAFTLGYTVRILGKHLFFSPFHLGKWKKERKQTFIEQKCKFMSANINNLKTDDIPVKREALAFANVSPSYWEDQNLSQLPTVKEDRDGCLPAKL